MWKKHKKELVSCILAPVIIVVLLLVLVWLFEYFGIHVPGNREMWIGLMGAVIGGTFTLMGGLITIFKQEYSENEQRRLQNMPILGFEICDEIDNINTILTYTKDGLITSGFPDFEKMDVMCIKIRTANNLPIFNFTFEGCAINGKEVCLTDAFNPSKTRIIAGELNSFAFNYNEDLRQSIFCIIRFSYEDIFGNKYYQDLPFIYLEGVSCEKNDVVRQIIEIRDINPPVLWEREMNSLENSAKEYIDYATFCNN